jgi:hypothetical protein
MEGGERGDLAQSQHAQRRGNGAPAGGEQGAGDEDGYATPGRRRERPGEGRQPANEDVGNVGTCHGDARIGCDPMLLPVSVAASPSMSDPEGTAEPLAAFCLAHRVRVEKRPSAYVLLSLRTGAPIARLRLAGENDRVTVFWWTGARWSAPGPFGAPTMSLERALGYIASERAFWIHA